MTAIRKEILSYIDELPDNKLEALKPLLTILINDSIHIETDLTEEEKSIISKGRNEYQNGLYIPLDDLL